MRLRHRDGQVIHLGYCTNVHPGEDLPEIMAQLDAYAVAVRRLVGANRLGLGLWLAAPVAAQLAADRDAVARLRRDLDARGLEVVTFNGFPYQSFHAPVVKHAVYQPDWLTPERMDYTLNLAQILAGLLPEDAARGSVSTLPLAWRTPWTSEHSAAARRRLADLAASLAVLHAQTGRLVRVAFEPEPGCVLESTAQTVTELSGVDTEYLGVCLDLAHLACAWEEPAAALARLASAGLPVVKVQVSAALGAERPDEAGTAAALRGYVEPRFLHQTRSAAGGCITTYRCTPPLSRRCTPPSAYCGPPWPLSSAARPRSATTLTWRPTPGACCRWHSVPPARRSWPRASPRNFALPGTNCSPWACPSCP